MNEKLLTIDELADVLKIPKNTIYYWVSRGEIPFLKIGKHLRFQMCEILDFFREKHASEASLLNCDNYVDSNGNNRSLKIRQKDKPSGP